MKLNRKILFAVITAAFFIQVVIISYNHLTGFFTLTGPWDFLLRLLIGGIFTSVFGLAAVYLDIKIINWLDRRFPLPDKTTGRIPVEFISAVIAGVLVGSCLTFTADLLMPYPDGLLKNIINNSLITVVINLGLVLAIEAILWFYRSRETKLIAETLQRENSEIKFATLKSQLNPHFLFNSMNVLSSLIRKDPEKAEHFVDQFSTVYRYTLDVIEKTVVELRDELEFARSYLYLQNIRFSDAVITEINVDVSKLSYFVPSLSVQILLENAFKHNRASADYPLKIEIFDEDNKLVVKNNLQTKLNPGRSSGIGLSNLKKRYALLGKDEPEFIIKDDFYIAKIPLINVE